MTINYATPVIVNGFVCRNCTDVEDAQKHIDPAHPQSGPYGIYAKDDPTVKNPSSAVVVFGGSLAGLNNKPTTTITDGTSKPSNVQGAAGTASATPTASPLDVVA